MKAQTQANQDVSAALDLLKVTLKEENDRKTTFTQVED